jgi:ribosomal protein S26
MEIGEIYDVVFSTGRYEVEYENCVKCIKKTPKSYRVEREDGTTRLVGQNSILELKKLSKFT